MADTREPSPRSSQVYRGGQPEEDKDDKTKTPGDVLAESGEYLKDPETEVDTSQPLQASGMPPEIKSDAWDPRQEERKKRINDRAQSQQQGSDIAKKKQTPEQRVNLPPFMESSAMDKNYAREQIGDEADVELQTISDEAGGLQNLDERTRIEVHLDSQSVPTKERARGVLCFFERRD